MEEACGLPHLTRLFPFGLCRYYMFFLIPIQQHGALKDFKNKPIRTVVDLFAGTEAVGYGAFPFGRWEEMQKVSLP